VQVSDLRGGIATQSYTLSANMLTKNKTPSITSSPRTVMAVGQKYVYLVQASTGGDGDPLTFSLTTKPTGMMIGSVAGYGNMALVTWTPTASQIGANSVTVSVAVNSIREPTWYCSISAPLS